MKKNTKVKNIIVKNAAGFFTPIILMFGFYIISHGHLLPGGGFQGGLLASAVVILIYLGYGYENSIKTFNIELLRKNEAIGGILYTFFALIGLFFFTNFCRNIIFDIGKAGTLFSSVFFINLIVGYKVLMGMGFLILVLLLVLSAQEKNEIE